MTTPLRLAPFLFAVLCFLLPFAAVKCEGREVTVTGYELLSGQKAEAKGTAHSPNYLLVATAALLVLGLLAAASPVSRKLAVVCAVAATICLAYFSYHIKEAFLPAQQSSSALTRDIQPSGLPELQELSRTLLANNVTFSPQPGLFAAMACSILAAVFSAMPERKGAHP